MVITKYLSLFTLTDNTSEIYLYIVNNIHFTYENIGESLPPPCYCHLTFIKSLLNEIFSPLKITRWIKFIPIKWGMLYEYVYYTRHSPLLDTLILKSKLSIRARMIPFKITNNVALNVLKWISGRHTIFLMMKIKFLSYITKKQNI